MTVHLTGAVASAFVFSMSTVVGALKRTHWPDVPLAPAPLVNARVLAASTRTAPKDATAANYFIF